MLSKLLILISLVVFVSCSGSDVEREYGNNLGGIGHNSSFESVEDFQYQLFNQKTIDSSAGACVPPLMFKDDQYLFATNEGKIISVIQGAKKWEAELDSGHFVVAGLSADKSGNIYAIDNKGMIYSFSASGTTRFDKQLITPSDLEIFNTPLTVGSNVVFSSSEGNLIIIDSNGNEVYSKQYNSSILNYVSAIDEHHILITLSGNLFGETDTLISINAQGKENWRFSSVGFRFLKGAITNSNYIAIGGSKHGGDDPLSKIFYLDKTGKLLWSKEISTIPRFLSMAIDGELYMVSYSTGMGQMLSGIFAFSNSGELDWKIYYEYSIPMPVYIAENELFFLASNRRAYGLFYLQRKDGKLIKTLDFGEVSPIDFTPEVGNDGTIVFAGKGTLRLIRVDETPINKILPY